MELPLKQLFDAARPKRTIYYNARITTEGVASLSNPQFLANFQVPIPQPFIEKAGDWNMSTVRVTATVHGTPALIVQHPDGGGSNPTTTLYTFTLAYGASSVTQAVSWHPADASLTQGSGDLGDQYWYEYSYLRMTSFINEALSTAMTALIGLEPLLTGVPAPFFEYDTATAVFSLWTPVEFLDNAAQPISLMSNEYAHLLMTGFPVAPTGIVGQDSRFLIFRQPSEPLRQPPAPLAGHDYVVRAQIPGSLCSWTPVRRYVLVTDSLPTVSEITVAITGYRHTLPQNQNPNTSQRVISDYTPVMVRGDELMNGTFEYLPTAQYRITNLLNSGAINEIGFSLMWEDALGGLHTHRLRFGGYASFKFAFLEK